MSSEPTLPPEKDPLIHLDHVGLFYRRNQSLFHSDKFWVLKDVNFSVDQGEIVGIIGENGAGKSTLLKLIGGILSPDRGILTKKPDMLYSLLSLQAGFQSHLSGRDNVMVNGVLLGISRKRLLACMDDIQEMADIGDFFDEPIKSYSNGMRSRLGFAIAYHVDPDVMLLDEILSVGDQEFTKKSTDLITEKINSGKTALIVSHSEHLLKDLCHRLIWVGEGRILEDGDTMDVWKGYASSYKKRMGWN